MPARKLNAETAAALGAADKEYDDATYPKSIKRTDAAGNEVILRNKAEIAAWAGISQGRYYELKDAGWVLKRGGGRKPAKSEGSENTKLVVNTLLEMLAEAKAENLKLEAQVADLENQLRNALRGRSFP